MWRAKQNRKSLSACPDICWLRREPRSVGLVLRTSSISPFFCARFVPCRVTAKGWRRSQLPSGGRDGVQPPDRPSVHHRAREERRMRQPYMADFRSPINLKHMFFLRRQTGSLKARPEAAFLRDKCSFQSLSSKSERRKIPSMHQFHVYEDVKKEKNLIIFTVNPDK